VPEFSGGFIDSGDGNDTETVYEYCRENFAFRPSKGYTEMTDLWKQSWADRDDKKYRGRYKGLPLYLVNTNSMQNLIRVCMRNSPGSPKSIQFAEDAPDILFQHIRNQRQYEIRRRGRMFLRWGKVRDKDDHLLDALMQAMFAGHAMGLHTVDFEAPPPPSQTTQPSRRIVLAGNLNGRS
jgi:phage terminase large subunit GpA-like protein